MGPSRIDVEKSSSHHVSQGEIESDKLFATVIDEHPTPNAVEMVLADGHSSPPAPRTMIAGVERCALAISLTLRHTRIAVQHYGSRDAMMEAARERADIADLVSSHLVREITLK